MHLYRILPDVMNPQVRRDLADPYQMHCSLARAFSASDTERSERFLWRLEADRGAAPFVLVQSEHGGHWARLLERFPGYALDIAHKSVDLASVLQSGRDYLFRLQANPSVTRGGKRHGLVREEDQLGWLARQGDRFGFGITSCLISKQRRIGSPRRKSGGTVITVFSCQFDGRLEVRNTARVAEAMANGIGHAKSLGLGLLSIARA
ncbi:MAG: type I-E CRISPR-associated protein Cas6/Cse3/CasE [Pseudomonadota bacterium]